MGYINACEGGSQTAIYSNTTACSNKPLITSKLGVRTEGNITFASWQGNALLFYQLLLDAIVYISAKETERI